jgi:pimeloyl-ACP methyl ester carboxylesterase
LSSTITILKSVILICLLALLATPVSAHYNDRSQETFVLVHGATGGGWDWRTMENILVERGHKVHRITLTGLGERAHLSSSKISLTTHITDVVNTVIYDELDEIILVGHSYGGIVVTGVMNSIPKKVKHAVFLDAAVPNHGMSIKDLWTDDRDLKIKDGVVYFPWLITNSKPPHDVPQSLATLTEPVSFDDDQAIQLPATYVAFVSDPTIREIREKTDPSWKNAKARGWPIHILQSDHNAQRSHPVELADLLEQIVSTD